MRSISQSFADHLQAREFDVALIMLRQHGVKKTKAHLWIANHGWRGVEGETQILEHINASDLTVQEWNDAYLRRLAIPADHNGHDPILEWMTDKVDFSLLHDRAVIHHASFHGRYEMLEDLSLKIQAAGKSVDWNDDRPALGTPLFIALREGHEETSMTLIRLGADGEYQMNKGVRKTGAATRVVDAATIAGGNTDIADLYKKAKRRVSLEQIAQKAGKLVGIGRKKSTIKM